MGSLCFILVVENTTTFGVKGGLHSGNHYILTGGATGCHYVDILTEEAQQFAVGNYSSECISVF